MNSFQIQGANRFAPRENNCISATFRLTPTENFAPNEGYFESPLDQISHRP